MMYAVIYLSSKLGQVSGKGLFHNLKEHYPRWILWPTLIGVLLGNTVEAAADLGGMAAAVNLFVPVPIPLIVVVNAAIILALQIWGSYELIRNIFRWLALALLAYVGSAQVSQGVDRPKGPGIAVHLGVQAPFTSEARSRSRSRPSSRP